AGAGRGVHPCDARLRNHLLRAPPVRGAAVLPRDGLPVHCGRVALGVEPSSSACAMTAIPDERSLRYEGWRVVFALFTFAVFAWGLGFYGHGIYLAELQRVNGWSTSL